MKITIDLGPQALARIPNYSETEIHGILHTAVVERLSAIERRLQARDDAFAPLSEGTVSGYQDAYKLLNDIHKRLRAYPEAVRVER